MAGEAAVDPAQASGAHQATLEHWQQLRAGHDLQFAPPPPWQPDPPPAWLGELGRQLATLFKPLARLFGGAWPWVEKLLIALLVLGAAWLLWTLLSPLLKARRRPKVADDEASGWTPASEEAVALLRDAERLAAAGDFDGATHLLLRRSVQQLASARPGLVHPASTAREIAGMSVLPDAARTAFGTIASRVEASRYALRPLAQGDWLAARDAYAAFARLPFAESVGV
ncbi:hypothetical protein [Novosphingobium sp.]|uniref:hypothetical protein n=1 Tax=Novosphingobium sp. TaxID=1874826 RepID=UPI0031D85E01